MFLIIFDIDNFDSVEIGNINIQMQDLSERKSNAMDVESNNPDLK
jgi:hypothetical protein